MKYAANVLAAGNDPEQLEELYQTSLKANDEAEFRADLLEASDKSPDNMLFSAWRARFSRVPLAKVKRAINWVLAVLLGAVAGLLLWAISTPSLNFPNQVPYIVVFWSPIATIPAIFYLARAARANFTYPLIMSITLVVACMYILLLTPGMSELPNEQFTIIMAILLPLLSWIAIGITVMGFHSTVGNRFAFLIKSIEVMIAAGVYMVFGVIFGTITMGMFGALNIMLPDVVMRLAVCGGIGLISTMAVATMYDPHTTPEGQDFSQGLSKFIFTIVRLLLPMALFVLIVYIFVIPFNFLAPFRSRDLLIIYSVMQFAIIGLLIGVTPLRLDDLSEKVQIWLRRGIILLAILATFISLYALSAVIYRTALGTLTINRLTIIGWDSINIGILAAVWISQLKNGTHAWNERMKSIFHKAAAIYLIWTILLLVGLPLIFR